MIGDRHFHADGALPGQALTLVEAEEVERVGLVPARPAARSPFAACG